MELIEIAEGISLEEVQNKTEASFEISYNLPLALH